LFPLNPLKMSEKVVLVLGAGKNVGEHVAQHFSKNGYKVALASRTGGTGSSDAFLHIKADLSDPGAVKPVFAEVTARLGTPSVVIYNGKSSSNPSASC
jgi:NAD(P)-dependent dehydrogenase (short-subunit alcohol dehydrogenase family)